MNQGELLGIVGQTHGLVVQRTVEIYLHTMSICDKVRESDLGEVPDLHRMEWDMANHLARLVGISANQIRALATHIRMKLVQAQAEALLQTRT